MKIRKVISIAAVMAMVAVGACKEAPTDRPVSGNSKGDGQRGGAEAVVALLLALRQQSAQREISAECDQTSKEQKAHDCLSQKSQVRR